MIEVEVSFCSSLSRCEGGSSADAGSCVPQRLQERGWFAITETLLALTIFKDEFDSSFVLLFVSLLFLKVFHWLAGDRVELVSSPLSPARSLGDAHNRSADFVFRGG